MSPNYLHQQNIFSMNTDLFTIHAQMDRSLLAVRVEIEKKKADMTLFRGSDEEKFDLLDHQILLLEETESQLEAALSALHQASRIQFSDHKAIVRREIINYLGNAV
jgi:hypothetical protein